MIGFVSFPSWLLWSLQFSWLCSFSTLDCSCCSHMSTYCELPTLQNRRWHTEKRSNRLKTPVCASTGTGCFQKEPEDSGYERQKRLLFPLLALVVMAIKSFHYIMTSFNNLVLIHLFAYILEIQSSVPWLSSLPPTLGLFPSCQAASSFLFPLPFSTPTPVTIAGLEAKRPWTILSSAWRNLGESSISQDWVERHRTVCSFWVRASAVWLVGFVNPSAPKQCPILCIQPPS